MKKNAIIRKLARLLVSILAMIAAAAGSPGHGQDDVGDEHEIRAAMIFNIAKFVEWPASKADGSGGAFVLCELGTDAVTSSLEKLLRGQSIAGKPIALLRLNKNSAVGSCHLLHIAHYDRKGFENIAPELVKQSVLSIGSQDWLTSAGGVVSLPMVDDNVRIQVNLGVAQRSGLKVSSKLLKIATVLH